MNNQPEKEKVLIPCMKLCKKLKNMGYILKYRRLDALDYYHEKGDPDIEIWFSKNKILWVLMAECKRPDGGVLSESQIDCREKYKIFSNVIYEEIRSELELKKIIMDNADSQNFKQEVFDNFNESI